MANPPSKFSEEISLSAFLELTIGSTLKSAASADSYFEFGTSDNINLRLKIGSDGQPEIICFSTLNKTDVAPLRINISTDKGPITAHDLENRIFSLRQIYALSYLSNRDMLNYAYENIVAKQFDLEEKLLPAEDQLIISAINPGSIWITIAATTVKMRNEVMNAFSFFYPEGRDALLTRVRATTELKELEVEEKSISNRIGAAKGIVAVAKDIDSIQDVQMRKSLQETLFKHISVVNPEIINLFSAESEGKMPSIPRVGGEQEDE